MESLDGVSEAGKIGKLGELGAADAWKAGTWLLPAGRCCTAEARKAERQAQRHCNGRQRATSATWQLNDSSGSCQGIRAVLQQLLLLRAAAAWHVQLSVGRTAALLQLGHFRSSHQAGAAVLLQGKLSSNLAADVALLRLDNPSGRRWQESAVLLQLWAGRQLPAGKCCGVQLPAETRESGMESQEAAAWQELLSAAAEAEQ